MKIAVTYDNGQVFQHFGHTEFFKIYTIENNAVVSAKVFSTGGSGHSALASYLGLSGVDILLCGGIGGGAVNALAQAGIRVMAGVSGDADKAIEALLNGTLVSSPNANCNHHHHDGEHECGEHSCGEHTCGEH